MPLKLPVAWLACLLSTATALQRLPAGLPRTMARPIPTTIARGALDANIVDDPTKLPGDPSLILHTNVKMGEKMEFLKSASSLIASCLGKPESYVAVAVIDEAAIVWGGADQPCALGVLNR